MWPAPCQLFQRMGKTFFNTTIKIASTPERVWAALADIERWPEWTPTVSRLELLSGLPFGVGSRVRIHQPKLRPAVWEVTRWEAGQGFAWTAKHPGVRAVGEHIIEAADDGCIVTLKVCFDGPFGSLAGWLAGRLTTRYLTMEAEGLKKKIDETA